MTVLNLPNGIQNKQRPVGDDGKVRTILTRLNSALDEAIVTKNKREPYGLHKLGVGSIGKDCERQLWYDFRKVKTPKQLPVNVLEIFETGNIYEERAIKLFEAAGQEIYYADPETGKQFKSSAEIAHLSGRVDMFWKVPDWHNFVVVLDPKSFNSKNFKQYKDKGVRISKHEYFVQASKYAKDYGLNYAGIVGFNKDNDERHIEIWHVDYDYITSIEDKAKRIISATEAPQRIANNSAAFKCKWCDYNEGDYRLCHEGLGDVAINCRSCKFAIATDNGKWFCEHQDVNAQIPDDFIMTGCQAHSKIV